MGDYWLLAVGVVIVGVIFTLAAMGAVKAANACPVCGHDSVGPVCGVDDEVSGWRAADPCECTHSYHVTVAGSV